MRWRARLRRLVPARLRLLRWQLIWLAGSEAFRDAPARSLLRLLDWTLRGLGRRELAFTTPDGLHFVSPPSNFTGLVLRVAGRKDPPMDRFIARHVRPGEVFVDCGANIGAYSIPAAATVGPAGRVVAIEAHPGLFGLLSRAVARNGLANVIALNMALGAGPGSVEIAYEPGNPGATHVAAGGEGGVAVPMATLDSALAAQGIASVAYIKIDVEGYELEVLAGAARTLAANPAVAVQTEVAADHLRRYGHDIGDLVRAMRAHGLRAHRIDAAGRAHPIAPAAPLPGEVVWLRAGA